jgi:hypothetical protein
MVAACPRKTLIDTAIISALESILNILTHKKQKDAYRGDFVNSLTLLAIMS